MLRRRATPPSIPGDELEGDIDGRCYADVLIIAGDASPGLCVITSGARVFRFDKRTQYGADGAWLIYQGEDLAEFECHITVWRDDQKRAFDLWQKRYLVKPPVQAQQNGKPVVGISQPHALGISNPILSDLGVSAVLVKKIGQWTKVATGRWQKVVSLIQFAPPIPATGRPETAISDTTKKAPVSASAQELENRAKRQTIFAQANYVRKLQGLPPVVEPFTTAPQGGPPVALGGGGSGSP
jgi:hypothetical protein